MLIGKTVTKDLVLRVAKTVGMRLTVKQASKYWPKTDRRREFVRTRLNPAGALELFANQSSGVMTSTVWADGLVDIAAGQTIQRGDAVRFLSLDGLTWR